MTQNIFKMLYIIAGFMIMLMGLFSFFDHQSRYSMYYQSVQEIQSQENSWIIDKVWEDESSDYSISKDIKLLSYEQLLTEIGGYYCFSKEVHICIEEYEYQGVLSEENMQELMSVMEKQKTYLLKVSRDDEGLQENILLEINEMEGNK